jgi:hypothetical protein
MSLCHDFQKWTMLTLSSIVITMIVGLVLMQYAHGVTPEGINPDAYIAKLEEMKKYCLDHVDRIVAGGNPVKDLINAGSEIFWAEAGKGENLADALGID